MTNIRNALMQAAGTAASGDSVYVEDVFSTFLYTGNATARSIVNGINLDATSDDSDGGLVWIKWRSDGGYGSNNNALFDTSRGVNQIMYSDTTMESQNTGSGNNQSLSAFNSNGFSLGVDSMYGRVNGNNALFCSWTFKKQEGFFDVVTYTGTGSSKTVSHNLGCVPGMIIVKMTTTAGYKWRVWHKSLGNSKALCLNDTSVESDDGGGGGGWWNNTAPTSSVFSVGTYGQVNNNGDTFVAYLFADGDSSDAQIFGDDGDEAIIKTGSYQSTGNGDEVFVNLGFEPQWIMIKAATHDAGNGWIIQDNIRGMAKFGNNNYLLANTSGAKNSDGTGAFARAEPNGMTITLSALQNWFQTVQTYVYVAIRRGPMKEPTAGTDVYAGSLGGNSPMSFTAGFPVDMAILKRKSGSYPNFNWGRLFGDRLQTDDNAAIVTGSSAFPLDSMTQTGDGWGSDDMAFMFRRYPKVFDVVVGESDASGNVWNGTHNLGANIEFAIVKNLESASTQWWTADLNSGKLLKLNQNASGGSLGTDFTTTTTTFKAFSGYLENSETFVLYAFASLSGISKVSTYSGTGNDVNVTGLGAAARFVLIKRTDATGDWYVYDSTRGIVSGNDPYIFFNNQDAEVTNTDYIDPHSSGFTITSSAPDALNASGGTYLYLAFA